MRRLGLGARLALGVAVVVAVLALRWLWVATSVGAGFAAHVTCSLVFVSGQDAERVLDAYVALQVAPLGPALDLEVGPREVAARVLGVNRARAVYRPGLGCTQVYGDPPADLTLPPMAPPDPTLSWEANGAAPVGPAEPAVEAAIDRAFAEPDPPRRRQTTAVVVVQDGRLIAERYAPGYGPATPLLSWSMAKSVLATLVGLAAEDGLLDLTAPAPVPEWSGDGDPRRAITPDALLRMSSGLRFDESYGPTSDASVMLFTRPDVAHFAARKRLAAPPDTRWSYSSGSSNLLARLLRDAFGDDVGAFARWARERLFAPSGITSAVLEPDASGSFIGSSFAFMTARDWARFGELHRRDGRWRERRVLPEAWVERVTAPTPAAPKGDYGGGWWLNAGAPGNPADRPWPELPPDTYAARGHSGQYVIVVPSARLVVVRLGLSHPSDGDDGAHALVAELLARDATS